jgi:glycosyltransferase involved in cell wall biosynthesis
MNKKNRKLKILILSNPLSVHSIRWVKQLQNTGWEINLFCPVAPKWSTWANNSYNKTLHDLSQEIAPIAILSVKINTIYRLLDIIRRGFRAFSRMTNTNILILDTHFDNFLSRLWQKMLIQTLDYFQPDVVHSLGINQAWQNLCLPILEQKRKGTITAPWIYSSWGTDLTFYPGLSLQNREGVQAIVQSVDYYISECKRDYEIALQYGFRGRFLGFLPAFGGINVDKINRYRKSSSISERKSLYIKGRGVEDPVGRAMIIMDTIEKLHDTLSGYNIYIGLATTSIVQKALEIKEKYGLSIIILPFAENPEDVLNYVGSSRVFISITLNDGLPASLVEAMVLGAFPIFSNLPSIGEWVTQGENGLLVDLDNPEKLAEYIQLALQDDDLVNQAGIINTKIVQEKLEYTLIRDKTIAMYQQVAQLSD